MRWVQFLICSAAFLVISSLGAMQSPAEDGGALKKLWPNRQATSRGVKPPTRATSRTRLVSQSRAAAHSEPSMIERLTSGSRTLWDRTKALVAPGTSNKRPSNKRQRRSPSIRDRSRKPSAFERIFGRGEPNSSPKTVTGFLKQDRPG